MAGAAGAGAIGGDCVTLWFWLLLAVILIGLAVGLYLRWGARTLAESEPVRPQPLHVVEIGDARRGARWRGRSRTR